jgi:UDP-N-acetylmuramoyl-tripeptide--D-alanyl-D-alanine ligase
MIIWKGHEISQILGIAVETDFTGVSIDTRNIKPGDIFVAIKGNKQDGHAYVAEAFAKGAKLAIVSKPTVGRTVVVPDTLKTLEQIAEAARKRNHGQIIAITGSCGKTSTKTILGKVLGDYVSPGGLNNHWGVPLSMANMPADTKIGVFEVGMNHAGELDHLTSFVQPTITMITNVESVHIGNFANDAEQIAAAKSEIFNHVKSDCTAVLNQENRFYDYLFQVAKRKGIQRLVTFGAKPESTVRLLDWQQTPDRIEVRFAVNNAQHQFSLRAFGQHWVMNGLGVIAATHAAGVDIDKACQVLSNFELLPGRGQLVNLGKISILDESYNASPMAMGMALGNLGLYKGRKVAVLGDMGELGEVAEKEHLHLAELIAANKVSLVFTSGPLMEKLHDALPAPVKGLHNDDPAALGQELYPYLQPGDRLLIKGSRGNYGAHGRMHSALLSIMKLVEQET